MIPSPQKQKDPGRKKPNDAYTSEQNADKIVNEEDQSQVSNAQQTENTNDAGQGGADEDKISPDVLTNPASIEDASHHPESATPELIEEERKEEAGINP